MEGGKVSGEMHKTTFKGVDVDFFEDINKILVITQSITKNINYHNVDHWFLQKKKGVDIKMLNVFLFIEVLKNPWQFYP